MGDIQANSERPRLKFNKRTIFQYFIFEKEIEQIESKPLLASSLERIIVVLYLTYRYHYYGVFCVLLKIFSFDIDFSPTSKKLKSLMIKLQCV